MSELLPLSPLMQAPEKAAIIDNNLAQPPAPHGIGNLTERSESGFKKNKESEELLIKNEKISQLSSSIMSQEVTNKIDKYGEPSFTSNLTCYYGTERIINNMHYFDAMKVGPKIFVQHNMIQCSEKIKQMVAFVRYETKTRTTKKGETITTLLPSVGVCTKKNGRRQENVFIDCYPPSSVRIPEKDITAPDEFAHECKTTINKFFTELQQERSHQEEKNHETPPTCPAAPSKLNAKPKATSARGVSTWQLFSKNFFKLVDVSAGTNKEVFAAKQKLAAKGWNQFPYDSWLKKNPKKSIEAYAVYVSNEMKIADASGNSETETDSESGSESDTEEVKETQKARRERQTQPEKEALKKGKEQKTQQVTRTNKTQTANDSRSDTPVDQSLATTQTSAIMPNAFVNYLLSNIESDSSSSSSSSSTSSSSESDDTVNSTSSDSDNQTKAKKNKKEKKKEKRKDKTKKKKENHNKNKKKKETKKKEKKEKRKKERKRKRKHLALLATVSALASGSGSVVAGLSKKPKSTSSRDS